MKTKVITLPKAKERQKRIKTSFDANSILFDFVDGVEFKDCQFHEINGKHYVENKKNLFEINEDLFVFNTNRSWMRFGEIGAYIAHYNLWKEFNYSNNETILICEDDAYPQSDMTFLNKIDLSNVGFINLQTVTAHNQDKQPLYKEPFVSFENNGLVKYKMGISLLCEGLTAYMLTKTGSKILCEYIEKNGFVGPNDCLITKLAEQNILPVYSPVQLEKCFGLDAETNQISYTHSGTFRDYKKFNKTTLQIKDEK